MKLIIIGIILAVTSIVNAASSPFIPEVESRFVAIESVNTTNNSDIDTLQSDLDTAEASLSTAETNITTLQTTQKIKSVTATYDFAVDGGDTGAIGSGVTIPDNAVIVNCYIDILTAMSSTGDNGTIAVHAQSANDLLSAVDADTISGIVACVPDGTAAAAIKLTAAREITFTIGTNALLSGKFVVVVQYAVTE